MPRDEYEIRDYSNHEVYWLMFVSGVIGFVIGVLATAYLMAV